MNIFHISYWYFFSWGKRQTKEQNRGKYYNIDIYKAENAESGAKWTIFLPILSS